MWLFLPACWRNMLRPARSGRRCQGATPKEGTITAAGTTRALRNTQQGLPCIRRRTCELAPAGQVRERQAVADQVGAQLQVLVGNGARRLQRRAGRQRPGELQPLVDLRSHMAHSQFGVCFSTGSMAR